MKQMKKLLILMGVLVIMASPALGGQVHVITGSSTSVDSIDEGTIGKIFLGKTKSLPNGSPVEFVVLKSGGVHEDFLKHFVKKSPSQFKTYWKKQVFTGKGKQPKSFDSEAELVAYVIGKSGVIGYVSAGTDAAGAKVINKNY